MPHEFFAVLLLGSLFVVPVVWLVRIARRTSFTPFQFLLWVTAKLIVRLLWRAEIPSSLPKEAQSGVVVVCNHRSSIDPFFLQMCCTRPMHWMVAKEYCEHPAFRWFLTATEPIPVNRGGIDTASTKMAIRYGREGGLVGMFPEGRINMSEEFMLPIRPGAVLVALRARVPILPCYIEGSPYNGTPWSPFFMRAHVRIHFGELVDTSPYADQEHDDELVKELMTRVVKSIAQLAGHDDFEPTFAGRRWKPTDEELQVHFNENASRKRASRRQARLQ
jgi:1-acyl-sn-glycerol-3-phosphate acyltransferase